MMMITNYAYGHHTVIIPTCLKLRHIIHIHPIAAEFISQELLYAATRSSKITNKEQGSRSSEKIENHGFQINDEQHKAVCSGVAMHAEHFVHGTKAV